LDENDASKLRGYMNRARQSMTDLKSVGGPVPCRSVSRKATLVPLSNDDHAFDFDAKSMRLVMGLHDVDSLTGLMEFDEIVHNELNPESPTPSSFRHSLSYRRRPSSSVESSMTQISMTQVLDDWEPEDIYDHPHHQQGTPPKGYPRGRHLEPLLLPDGDRESFDGGFSSDPTYDCSDEEGSYREYTPYTPTLVRRISRDEETEMRQELRILTRKHSESLSRRELDAMNGVDGDCRGSVCSSDGMDSDGTDSDGADSDASSSASPISKLSGGGNECSDSDHSSCSSSEYNAQSVERGHLLREHSADKWDDETLENQTQEMQRQISRLCSQHLTV